MLQPRRRSRVEPLPTCRHSWVALSSHATSEGTVTYERCGCGRFRVRLTPLGG